MAQKTVRTVTEVSVVTRGGTLVLYPLECAVNALAAVFREDDAARRKPDILMAICVTIPPVDSGVYTIRLEQERQMPWRELSSAPLFHECSIVVLHRDRVIDSVCLADAQKVAQSKEGKIVNFFS